MSQDRLGFHPSTPHPVFSDPTWGTFQKSRSQRHLLSTQDFEDPLYLSDEDIYIKPRRLYSRSSKRVRSREPSDHTRWRSSTAPWETYTQTEPLRTSDVYNIDSISSKRPTNSAIQRRIDLHNAEIAARPSRPRTLGSTRHRRVRFKLPENEFDLRTLTEKFDRFGIREDLTSLRCSSCGQRLPFDAPNSKELRTSI